MRPLKLRTAILLWSALIVATAFAASGAMAAAGSTPKKVPAKVAAKAPALCTLGQKTTAALKCTPNPSFGHDACAQFVPAIQSGIGATATPTANGAAPAGIQCYYVVGGKAQAFGIKIFGDTPKSVYSQEYQSDVSEVSGGLSCNAPGNPPATGPLTVSGLGDEAFSWDPCPGTQDDYLNVIAVKGTTYYAVIGQIPYTSSTIDNLTALARQLMAKYS
jgi:hypothetical protein